MILSAKARELLTGTAEQGRIPGGTAASGTLANDAPVFAFGKTSPGGARVTPETRYDLASLTKVTATLPSVLRLVAEGELDLDRELDAYFSNIGWFRTPSLAGATPRQLLAHNSGLPGWARLFAITTDRLVALGATQQTPLQSAPGGAAVYSDLGFMLLGALVERVSRLRLDEFAARHVFGPLGMGATGFRPRGTPIEPGVTYAPTEDCGWRNRVLVGEVHDENCYAWEGVAGHAGLFGTARDLAAYCRAWLELDSRLGPEELLLECLKPHAETATGERRGLGWITGPDGMPGGLPGFGHTGFTGTSLWIDPSAERYAVLLTNRVHPDRNRDSGIVNLRKDFHRAVWEDA